MLIRRCIDFFQLLIVHLLEPRHAQFQVMSLRQERTSISGRDLALLPLLGFLEPEISREYVQNKQPLPYTCASLPFGMTPLLLCGADPGKTLSTRVVSENRLIFVTNNAPLVGLI